MYEQARETPDLMKGFINTVLGLPFEEVGSYPANPFGLYNMLGNVWEWVYDCWNDNYEGAPDDGSAWTSGDCGRRVLRGGSWSHSPVRLRSASRGRSHTYDPRSYIGFRVARTLR
jgi:formylglycine-generating enzyme required for sulfatase activity